jgi:alkaline phosphatase D
MPNPLDAWLRTPVSRRSLLASTLALCAVPIVGATARRRHDAPLSAAPFSLGIASGDPTSTGVVLWTRLAWQPLQDPSIPSTHVQVHWEVASDERMTRLVKQGVSTARPEWAHSVHVEVDGLLPDRWYWYRFRVDDHLSEIGRTRTLPRAGASVDRLRFGFCSCSHYEAGLFTAYRHMAAEELDLVFHLGDYIYEGPANPAAPAGRSHYGTEILTLADYRVRYAQYHADADLQAAHAAFPWIVTWDDHEVDNNYADAVSEHDDPDRVFLLRRAAAYQAFYEHMPIRLASLPTGPWMRIYRQFEYGSLASFFVLDTRQYRTNQPCGDGNKVPCAGAFDPRGTLLGDSQAHWLFDGLEQSGSAWNVLPQQVMMARIDQMSGPEERYSMDQWPGYEVERQRVLEFFGNRPSLNPVVLTGDIHANYVNDLVLGAGTPRSRVVGTEFVGTSITSGSNGVDAPARLAMMLAENPELRFHNTQRGYVTCEMTPKTLRANYQVLEYVTRPDSPKKTRGSFVVEHGKPGALMG